MTKEIWINLPVKDINKSKEFFKALGFSFDSKFGNTPVSACMQVGSKNVIVMMFEENVFKNIAGNNLPDTSKATEVLFSFDAESTAEVDELAIKVTNAGGNVFSKPAENQGWMYGCGFTDLDGHRWNILYMDMAKMPK